MRQALLCSPQLTPGAHVSDTRLLDARFHHDDLGQALDSIQPLPTTISRTDAGPRSLRETLA